MKKENILMTVLIVLMVGGLIYAFVNVLKEIHKSDEVFFEHQRTCQREERFYMSVRFGGDISLGKDYERAKEMAQGKPIYVQNICVS